MKKPRDSQRSRVYASEHIRQGYRPAFWSVDEMQRYVDKLTRSAWFSRRWHYHRITVLDGRARRSACAGPTTISIPQRMRNEVTVLHEVAHVVTWGQGADHGWQFCAAFLELVHHCIGKDAGDALRESFKAHKVRYRQPRQRAPLSEAAKAALRERLAKGREAAASRGQGET
jgi:putative metallohydrolase (TIGR04338 family)